MSQALSPSLARCYGLARVAAERMRRHRALRKQRSSTRSRVAASKTLMPSILVSKAMVPRKGLDRNHRKSLDLLGFLSRPVDFVYRRRVPFSSRGLLPAERNAAAVPMKVRRRDRVVGHSNWVGHGSIRPH